MEGASSAYQRVIHFERPPGTYEGLNGKGLVVREPEGVSRGWSSSNSWVNVAR